MDTLIWFTSNQVSISSFHLTASCYLSGKLSWTTGCFTRACASQCWLMIIKFFLWFLVTRFIDFLHCNLFLIWSFYTVLLQCTFKCNVHLELAMEWVNHGWDVKWKFSLVHIVLMLNLCTDVTSEANETSYEKNPKTN